ncbi:lytic transglycosylase domain-containing protein [Shimia sp. CNT1-13L.2]|uniref:lytic transglycosylase domain-containing protein n=1 Tax=Shimia sp. CNT1-13L.2 TaxID=2959663 RepID=UPI0034E96DE3
MQISEEAAAPVPVEQEVATTAPYAARYDWFWEEVSPQMSESGPGRLATALQHLSTPPEGKGVSAPRLQALQKIAQAHARDILIATVGTDVSPALVLAVIAVESGGDGSAVSGAGAEGLMQLMPVTAERFGVSDSFAADENIKGGVAFLDLLMKTFERDPILVLAGYNAGENAVKQAQGVPEYAETRDYVPKVLAAYAVARGLCRTPPELISDGCVFVTQ